MEDPAHAEGPPTPESCAAAAPHCYPVEDGCVCDAVVVETAAFVGAEEIAEGGGILSRLKVGAFDVAVFDGYTSLRDCGLDIVAVYTNSGATCDALDAHVIFRVFNDNGQERYLKKVLSVVNVLGVDLSFRKIERE